MRWNSTIVHICAASYISHQSREGESAAVQAANRRTLNYEKLPASFIFQPVAIETMGRYNPSALAFIGVLAGGHLRSLVTGEKPPFFFNVSLSVPSESGPDEYWEQFIELRRGSMPEPAIPFPTRQSAWDRPVVERDKAEIRLRGNDLVSRARLDAAAGLHSADWLMAMPIASCGLALDNEAVRVAVGLRLGLDPCGPHVCHCGAEVGPEGHHGLVCRKSQGRSQRHFAINDIIWRALVKAGVPSTKEPLGLFRSDGKRPDGATLVPWSHGRYLAWDATV